MADLMKKLGWIAWCLTVIDWFLSPIISLHVNKTFDYLVFNTSEKLKELQNEIIRELKKKLRAVEKQTVLSSAVDKGSLKVLDSMKMDLKSALYEAEDILDLLDYRQIEKDLHHVGDHDSRWVEKQLGVACAWIARCKGSSLGHWTLVGAMKSAQRIVVQCAQSWYQQLGQLFRGVIIPRSGEPLLPVSVTEQPPRLQSRSSEFVAADASRKPAETEEIQYGERWSNVSLRDTVL